MRPEIFYDLRHVTLFETLLAMFKAGQMIDLMTVQARLKARKNLALAGGIAYLSEVEDAAPSPANWSYYLEIISEKFRLRKTIQVCSETVGRIMEHEGDIADLMLGVRADMEIAASMGLRDSQPLRDIISPAAAAEFEPDPESFLVGDGRVMRGQFMCIAGEPGVGKSRLATTGAGAGGINRWQNYPVRTQWKTLILQTENLGDRLKDEFESVPKAANDFIRVSRSLSSGMAFGDPEFRAELLRFLIHGRSRCSWWTRGTMSPATTGRAIPKRRCRTSAARSSGVPCRAW